MNYFTSFSNLEFRDEVENRSEEEKQRLEEEDEQEGRNKLTESELSAVLRPAVSMKEGSEAQHKNDKIRVEILEAACDKQMKGNADAEQEGNVWRKVVNEETNSVYYWNVETNETQWQHPNQRNVNKPRQLSQKAAREATDGEQEGEKDEAPTQVVGNERSVKPGRLRERSSSASLNIESHAQHGLHPPQQPSEFHYHSQHVRSSSALPSSISSEANILEQHSIDSNRYGRRSDLLTHGSTEGQENPVRDSKEWKEKMKKYVKERGAEKGLKDFVSEMNISLPTRLSHNINVKFDPVNLTYSFSGNVETTSDATMASLSTGSSIAEAKLKSKSISPADRDRAIESFREATRGTESLSIPGEVLSHFGNGVSLTTCPRVSVKEYTERIPAVLMMLQKLLYSSHRKETCVCQDSREAFTGCGLNSEGLFRIAPEKEGCRHIRDEIDQGKGLKGLTWVNNEIDPHICANLIKQYFRELEPNLLNCLSREAVFTLAAVDASCLQETLSKSESSQTEEAESLAACDIPEPNKSVFYWLLDLLAEVSLREEKNRMSVQNLAIVVAPNLFSSENQTPMEALVLSQKTAALVKKFLTWRRDRLVRLRLGKEE